MSLTNVYNCFFSELQLKRNKIFLSLAIFTFCFIDVFAQNSSLINDCDDFITGPNTTWTHVLVATTIDDGIVSQEAQTFTMNITSLPEDGANFRVYKTVANGNDFFGNPIALTLGLNSFTVPAVNFDRAVKFQFSSGDVIFDALNLNGESTDCVEPPVVSDVSAISSCSDFVSGPNATWTHVLIATTIEDGVISQGPQTFSMNIVSLPEMGANFRVYKTVANGNDFFGNPIPLTLGLNTITVDAVDFDRAVKFQFSSGDVEFDALSLNEQESECVINATEIEISKYDIYLNTFPNPSRGELFIESNDLIKSLKIKDLSGKVVFEIAPQKRKVHINISQLDNSFYFLSCFIKQEWVTRKIIYK